jgi:hypothetical protein
MDATQSGEDEQPDPGTTLVLNALVDAVGGHRSAVGDESSRDLAQDAFEALPADRQEAFRDAVDRLDEAEDDPERASTLAAVADRVADELADRGVRVRLDHEATVTMDDRDARVYTFTTIREPAVLEPLGLPDAAEPGIEAAVDGDYDAAADAFETAVDVAGARAGAVSTRALAGWAAHRAGEDDRAMDFVEEAMHLEVGAWAPRFVGLAASHRYPEKFRRGKLGVRFFLRQTAEVPAGAAITNAVRYPDRETWEPLEGPNDCKRLDRLLDGARLRVRVEGSPTGSPALLGYYVGLGVVDLEVDEVRGVENVFLSGPTVGPEARPTEVVYLEEGER